MSEHSPIKEAIFIPLTGVREENRAETLLMSVSTSEGLLISDLRAFTQIPNAPLSYWLTPRCMRLPALYPPLQSERRAAKQGLATADDFRFLRLWWEISPKSTVFTGSQQKGEIAATFHEECAKQTTEGRTWVPYAKGGSYSPYYADVYLVVNWRNNGEEIRHFRKPNSTRLASRPQNIDHYFHPGLTWPLRTNGLSFRVMPAGCVFGHKGPCLFAESNGELLRLMAFLNTDIVVGLVHALGVGRVEIQSYEVGTIQGIPVPPLDPSLAQHAESGYYLARSLDITRETSHMFHRPAALSPTLGLAAALDDRHREMAHIRDSLAAVRNPCEQAVLKSFALSPPDIESLKKLPGVSAAKISGDEDEDDPAAQALELRPNTADLLCWLVGACLGRWDVRIAMDPSLAPRLSEPFDPLPVCPPGMLVGPDGLPADPNRIVSEEWLRSRPDANTLPLEGSVRNPIIPDSEYPLRIDWDGILVDDPGNEDDIVRRVRDVLEVIWRGDAEAVEGEACEILGVRELRDYFRKHGKGGFWVDHVKRYSKSRRNAPIYWYLRSAKGNYGLWLYYHRLDKDILFKALLNYVEPKIRMEEDRLKSLRGRKESAGKTGREAKQIEKDMDRQEQFVSELHDFADKLRRAANLHLVPDLNDGVVLTIAPLFELVPWKDAKENWEDLVEGKYEWSSIGKLIREKGLVKK